MKGLTSFHKDIRFGCSFEILSEKNELYFHPTSQIFDWEEFVAEPPCKLDCFRTGRYKVLLNKITEVLFF